MIDRVRIRIVAMVWLMLASAAPAHLGGEQSVDQVVRVRRAGDKLIVRVELDMAEFPGYALRRQLDTSGDREISKTEERIGMRNLAQEIQRALRLRIGGVAVRLRVKRLTFEFGGDRGAAQIPIRVAVEFHGAWPAAFADGLVELENRVYADRPVGFVRAHLDVGDGWSATLDPKTAATIARYEELNQRVIDGKVPELPSGEKPPQFRALRWTVAPATTEPATGPETAPSDPPPAKSGPEDAPRFSSKDRRYFWDFFKNRDYGLYALLGALALAFVYGMGHALTPGHGKAITGAFLVGHRGTIWDAIVLGITVTITHTLAVYVLGIAADAATVFFPQDEVIRWLEIVSAVLIIALGMFIFLRHLWALASGTEVSHGHSHDHVGGHTHGHAHGHAQPRSHDHGHEHAHDHGDDQGDDQGDDHDPGARERPRLWQVIYLGITGGMIPCPTGLFIISIAFRYQVLGLGLLLAAVFSLGMAVVLVGIGVLTVKGFGVAERYGSTRVAAFFRVVPVISGAFITVIGLLFLGASLGWLSAPWLQGQ